MNAIEAQEAIEATYTNALQLQDRPKCMTPQCESFWDWHKDDFCRRNYGCTLTQEEVLANPRPVDPYWTSEAIAQRLAERKVADAFAVPERTPEAIAQDDRQAADFGGHSPEYHAALVVICEEQGAGRYARAIDLVAKIWGKSPDQVLHDAVML